MFSPKSLLATTLFTLTYGQDAQLRPVALPDITPLPKVMHIQTTPPLPVPSPPFRVKARTTFAVYNQTVYLTIGDMVIPMIGTTGCFTPKEILQTSDPRLRFERELPAPPPPPEPVKR